MARNADARSAPGGSPASLFDRRLVVLVAIALAVVSALGAQLLRLGVVEHEVHRENVERYLTSRRFLPAPRGRILDRRGEVLAADRASWDVLVEYEAITGRWATRMAQRQAELEIGRDAWRELSTRERSQEVLARVGTYDATLEGILGELAAAGGIDRLELDRRLDEIVRRTARVSRSRREALMEREVRLYGEDARLGEIVRERVEAELDAHVVLADVADETAFRFEQLAELHRGVLSVEPSTRRMRPWSEVAFDLPRATLPSPIRAKADLPLVLAGVADHLVGSTRAQVFPEDLARRPMFDPSSGEVLDLGGYRSDRDVVGGSGVERLVEDRLRGRRGVVEKDLETGEERRVEPVAGADVELTIDVRLEARLQGLFAPEAKLAKVQQYQRGYDPEGNPRGGPLPLGWELDGAIVVLDVATGELLAAVSSPTLAEGATMPEARRLQSQPEIFRPLAGAYQPGSILKPLVLCAAAAEGLLKPGEEIACKGHFFEDNRSAVRCWIYRPDDGRELTHGPLGAPEAIARSCNVYFYELARRLGPERLAAWMERFGLGSPVVADAPAEVGGSLPDEKARAAMKAARDRVTPVLLGIGQGPLTWTPVQAAQALATLARGGVVLPVRLLRGGDVGKGIDLPKGIDLGIPRFAIDAALDGLRASVGEHYGTAHHLTLADGREELFDLPDLVVWGKTGTATTSLLSLDGDLDGTAETKVRTDHAWFVGLVGPREGERGGRPCYAVAVLVEHGGSGGKVAAPIAAQAMRALAAEGYLGPAAQAGAGGRAR